ncbi:hypothetical protein BH09PSE1_BH09PSE1_10120 [soil metagenome]
MRSLCFAVTAMTLAAAGTASAQQTCEGQTRTIAAVGASAEQVREAEVIARSTYGCGHLWSASVLLENAVAARPTVLARFNLATSYAATRRYAASAELFRSVIEDGQFTTIKLDPQPNGPQVSYRVNAADEATRRLADVQRDLENNLSPASTGDFGSEDPATTTLAARVASIVDQTRVSGDRALFFDGLTPVPEALRPFQAQGQAQTPVAPGQP